MQRLNSLVRKQGFAPPFQTQDDGRFNYSFILDEDQLERFIIDIKIEDDSEEIFLLETNYEITISPQSEVTIDLKILNDNNKVFRGEILEIEVYNNCDRRRCTYFRRW